MKRVLLFLLALSLSSQVLASRNGGLAKIEKITVSNDGAVSTEPLDKE